MINQEITILDGVGLPAGLPDGEVGIKTSTAQIEFELGLSLAKSDQILGYEPLRPAYYPVMFLFVY